jgi:glycosyltransferase involved in cell wall biosynthesis
MDKIEFVIPTHKRVDLLITIISSIVAQTNPNWTIHVVADCPPEDVKERYLDILAFFDEHKDKIKFSVTKVRFNDWGHTPRNIGLQQATEEWVVMTGEDNYYAPTFVENFLSSVKDRDDVHFVFCNMVHNWVNDDYIPIQCEIEFGKIDIGNFMVRTHNGKKLELKENIEQADYVFIEEYLARFPEGKIIHVDKILYVHN